MGSDGQSVTRAVDASKLWAGGVATALVAALVALVAMLVATVALRRLAGGSRLVGR